VPALVAMTLKTSENQGTSCTIQVSAASSYYLSPKCYLCARFHKMVLLSIPASNCNVILSAHYKTGDTKRFVWQCNYDLLLLPMGPHTGGVLLLATPRTVSFARVAQVTRHNHDSARLITGGGACTVWTYDGLAKR